MFTLPEELRTRNVFEHTEHLLTTVVGVRIMFQLFLHYVTRISSSSLLRLLFSLLHPFSKTMSVLSYSPSTCLLFTSKPDVRTLLASAYTHVFQMANSIALVSFPLW